MKAIQYFLTVQLSPRQVLLAVLGLALVFIAFLPTLLVDYVPRISGEHFAIRSPTKEPAPVSKPASI